MLAPSNRHVHADGGRSAQERIALARSADDSHYKWTVLINATLGTLMASINSSILVVSLPPIFRGIGIDPLAANESAYFLWTLMGYKVITAAILVTCGRLSDIYGRTRLYVLGFAIFTLGSIALAVTPGRGNGAATFIIFMAGSLLGLLIGGLLATIDWRLVFLVSVPFGLFGKLWAYFKLHETTAPQRGERLDPIGNIAFATGLTIFLVALTYGIQPYGDRPTGWSSPWALGGASLGTALLVAFVFIELRTAEPLHRPRLFANRMFAAGNVSGFLSSLARGGLQFVIIIWLQGIKPISTG